MKPEYYERKAELERNARKGCCIICGHLVARGKRKYCSDSCRDNWIQQFKPPFLWNEFREKALKRDNYTCVKCGFKDTEREGYGSLIVDHIIPIALDGEEFNLNNLQTLCSDCNRAKTREDAGKIAELRRKIKDNEKVEELLRNGAIMKKKWDAYIQKTLKTEEETTSKR